MLERYLKKKKFNDYEDFLENFEILIPENFNFEIPEKKEIL